MVKEAYFAHGSKRGYSRGLRLGDLSEDESGGHGSGLCGAAGQDRYEPSQRDHAAQTWKGDGNGCKWPFENARRPIFGPRRDPIMYRILPNTPHPRTGDEAPFRACLVVVLGGVGTLYCSSYSLNQHVRAVYQHVDLILSSCLARSGPSTPPTTGPTGCRTPSRASRTACAPWSSTCTTSSTTGSTRRS